MHHPTDKIIHTTAFVTPVVEHWLERENWGSAMLMYVWVWGSLFCFVFTTTSTITTTTGGGGGDGIGYISILVYTVLGMLGIGLSIHTISTIFSHRFHVNETLTFKTG